LLILMFSYFSFHQGSNGMAGPSSRVSREKL
jgi:hypothetical protein